jgi:hypothetical protein
VKGAPYLGPFCPTEPPVGRSGKGRAPRGAEWVTWKDEARGLLEAWGELSGRKASRLRTHAVPGIRDEPLTYSLPEQAVPRELKHDVKRLATELSRLSTPIGVLFLRDLFRNELEGRGLRLLLAAVRHRLANETWIRASPMFPPTSRSALRFPLHADLWGPGLLLNVYERPARDGSGESLILSIAHLKQALSEANVPSPVRAEIASCLSGARHEFRFERLRELLHAQQNPWHERLDRELQRRTWSFWFDRGEGYLLHDRRWLHGRERIRVRSSDRRFFRLVFDNRELARRDS